MGNLYRKLLYHSSVRQDNIAILCAYIKKNYVQYCSQSYAVPTFHLHQGGQVLVHILHS